MEITHKELLDTAKGFLVIMLESTKHHSAYEEISSCLGHLNKCYNYLNRENFFGDPPRIELKTVIDL